MEMLKLTQINVFEGRKYESTVYVAKHAVVSVREVTYGAEITTNAIRNGGGCTISNVSYVVKETPEEICEMIG